MSRSHTPQIPPFLEWESQTRLQPVSCVVSGHWIVIFSYFLCLFPPAPSAPCLLKYTEHLLCSEHWGYREGMKHGPCPRGAHSLVGRDMDSHKHRWGHVRSLPCSGDLGPSSTTRVKKKKIQAPGKLRRGHGMKPGSGQHKMHALKSWAFAWREPLIWL